MSISNLLIFIIVIVWIILIIQRHKKGKSLDKEFKDLFNLVDKTPNKYSRIKKSEDDLPDTPKYHFLTKKLPEEIYEKALSLAAQVIPEPRFYKFAVTLKEVNGPLKGFVISFVARHSLLEASVTINYSSYFDSYLFNIATTQYESVPEEFGVITPLKPVKITAEKALELAEARGNRDGLSPMLSNIIFVSRQKPMWFVNHFFNKTGRPVKTRTYYIDALSGEVRFKDDVGESSPT